jgi:hypothetical protein
MIQFDLGASPTNAHSQHEPSAAELVEVGGHTRNQQRVVAVRQDNHGGPTGFWS